ncbi:hypothetical protein [Streptomyces sp. NPDC008125]|uniref:hypothetical protein n=1 Tax=Streptomyces sp. NPDC008125 TaxID=3364811 RepID=UPI0036EDB67D
MSTPDPRSPIPRPSRASTGLTTLAVVLLLCGASVQLTGNLLGSPANGSGGAPHPPKTVQPAPTRSHATRSEPPSPLPSPSAPRTPPTTAPPLRPPAAPTTPTPTTPTATTPTPTTTAPATTAPPSTGPDCTEPDAWPCATPWQETRATGG